METYYSLFALKPRAAAMEVEAAFRRFVARYRPTITTAQLFTDPYFMKHVNAWLTLRGDLRARHDALIARPAQEGVTLPTPLAEMSPAARTLLTARIGLWRREHIEGIHLLRALLEREPALADGWALLGEFFLEIDRLPEGIQAYERAVGAAPDNARFSARLQHTRDAQAGVVELQIELSPEEELLREERRQRRRAMMALLLLGLGFLAMAFIMPVKPIASALYVPWRTVIFLAFGVFFLLLSLSFGRLLPSFEATMLWSSLSAGDRGRVRHYPYALILIVTAAPSLWLAILTLLVMAFMDDEWPVPPTIMLGICAVVTLALVLKVALFMPDNWTGTLFMGGNALVYAAMLGWWTGSLGSGTYS